MLQAPTSVTAGARTVPAGPPRISIATPGDNVDALVATLPPGSTLRLSPGEYAGPVHLDRPMTLEGAGATLVGPGRGSVLVIGAPDVTVRGLAVRGGGHDATTGDAGVLVVAPRFHIEGLDIADVLVGLDLREADDGVVKGCVVRGDPETPMGVRGDGIRLWESDRNQIVDNQLTDVRDLVVWYSNGNMVRGNDVRRARYGVHFMHADENHVEGNRFEGDVVGVFVMYSHDIVLTDNVVTGADGAAGVGFGFKESDTVTVTGNRLMGNTAGIYLDSTPQRVGGTAVFRDNLLAYNHTGLRFHGVHAGASFVDNDLHENSVPVVVDGNDQATEVLFEGNRWSDYVGYDLDGDGYGDLAHAPRLLSRGMLERRPVARFFEGTPAATLLDFLGAVFPMWAPPPLYTDARPRMGGLR
ncbi:MAG: nitrous oxide reductase family maturation protein NosD [Pseudomonadota bacterium]|nr:nitrous oxide reductase family maturation protein NosD [Pseudomonadota bacterium]